MGLPAAWTQPGQERIEVPVVRVDDIVPADRSVDLVKIDVEGFEPLVLQGMQAVLARSPDAAVVVEVSYIQWARFGDPVQMLSDFAQGRRLYRIRYDGWLQELPAAEIDQALDRAIPSYMLVLPESRLPQVRRFLAGARPEGPPKPRPLLQRILRRLQRLR